MTRPGETGASTKPQGPCLSVALVYLNTYRVGMGNLGFQFLYHHINSMKGLFAERFFLPGPSLPRGGLYGRSLSEESARPLSRFPVAAFSIPFENDYPAVPGMLMAAGIPPFQKDRGPEHPLVIAGGVSVSMNPEPLAPFLDLVFIGEIPDREEGSLFHRLAEMAPGLTTEIRDRGSFLTNFRDVPGVYVPNLHTCRDDSGSFESSGPGPGPGGPDRVRAVKRGPRGTVVPVSCLFSPEAEFGEGLLVETNRGCGRSCRFCASGWIHFPVRYRPFDAFRCAVDEALTHGRTIGLIGSDLAGHPEIEGILEHIVGQGGSFSLSSIRPEGLTPRMIQLLAATGQKTATLAPETASSRMKRVIGKEIPPRRFLELVDRLVSGGIPNIRYYFMVGLPTETDEDHGRDRGICPGESQGLCGRFPAQGSNRVHRHPDKPICSKAVDPVPVGTRGTSRGA